MSSQVTRTAVGMVSIIKPLAALCGRFYQQSRAGELGRVNKKKECDDKDLTLNEAATCSERETADSDQDLKHRCLTFIHSGRFH